MRITAGFCESCSLITTLPITKSQQQKRSAIAAQSGIAAARRVQVGASGYRSPSSTAVVASTVSRSNHVNLVLLHRIEIDGRTFLFQGPLIIPVHFQEGMWTHEYEPWGIVGHGETEDASLEDFAIYFACTWDGLANENDANLTLDARELKNLLCLQVCTLGKRLCGGAD